MDVCSTAIVKHAHVVGKTSRKRHGWVQANKNTLIKGRVGTGGVSAALAFKAWWQPSFWFALSGGFDFRSREPKFGLTFGSENYGNIR